MQFAVQKIIELANAEGGFKPGDMWIMNDNLGGSHLQDVQIIAPVFAGGELFAVMATTGHWMDMGQTPLAKRAGRLKWRVGSPT